MRPDVESLAELFNSEMLQRRATEGQLEDLNRAAIAFIMALESLMNKPSSLKPKEQRQAEQRSRKFGRANSCANGVRQ